MSEDEMGMSFGGKAGRADRYTVEVRPGVRMSAPRGETIHVNQHTTISEGRKPAEVWWVGPLPNTGVNGPK